MAITIFAAGAMILTDTGRTSAQCAGGSGGASGARSGGVAGLSSGQAAFSNAFAGGSFSRANVRSPAFRLPPQFAATRQQMLANHQQRLRQQAEQRYEGRQEFLALRRQRAERVRTARADRALARLEAQGESAGPSRSRDSYSLYAAKSR